MSLKNETNVPGQKHTNDVPAYEAATFGERDMVAADQNTLHRDLKGRHMQMIAM